jgi:uncharacterized low-complexity protein
MEESQMAKCSAFHENPHNNGWDRCWATKETETCSCGGDEAKCDFYPEKRKAETQPKCGEWISVKDRLPPDQGKKVLVANGHGYISVFALWKKEYGNKWTWIDEQGHFKHTNDITHWMPLPEPPKEGDAE